MNRTKHGWEKWEPVDYLACLVILVTGTLLVFGVDGPIKGIFSVVVFRYFGPKVIHNATRTITRKKE